MSDDNNQPFFNIQRIYVKDMSLEQPNSPGIFLEQEMPSVEVEVDVKAERLAESVFEVLVTGTVTAKVSDKVAFLIEAKQAGIFDIRNIPAEQIDPLVGIACPTILFPYLRSNIADAITRAALPPPRPFPRPCPRTPPTRPPAPFSRRSTSLKSTSRPCTSNVSRSS